ncbi:MAG: GPR endopeptidase [Clostridia bacterium]|nr:GPR endopeptidase [Clostridia bacterium]
MLFYIRTDLALEAHEMYREQAKKEEKLDGVHVKTTQKDNITVTEVKISDEEGEKALGKPIGTYITIEAPQIMHSIEDYENTCIQLSDKIRSMAQINDDTVVLVVGLGNENITPDALGPKVVSRLMVTRHLKQYIPEHISSDIRSVCAVAPGVLGTTGIETAEIIKGVAEKVKPDLVIAVDALASRRLDRISTTIQIADTGISPGAGIGNFRMGLNQESLGVKVIAIGVPTVVDAATVASDSIDMMINRLNKDDSLCNVLEEIDSEERHTLIAKSISENIGELVVTPKDVDLIIDKVSKTVANGINLALHQNLTFEEIEGYVE